MDPAVPDPSKDCVLLRITQFECVKGDYIVCMPLERLFKKCRGQGSVELVSDGSAYVDVRTLAGAGHWHPDPAAASHSHSKDL
ncbi:hypothetical protein IWW47_004300 [Coemansia sp. RSA 2052]|nr:hypothetical protein IWW47_004300 [Coemansia sp. RSA 2052]